MSFRISKSKFVSAWERCSKYAWLDAHMPEKKSPVDEFTTSPACCWMLTASTPRPIWN